MLATAAIFAPKHAPLLLIAGARGDWITPRELAMEPANAAAVRFGHLTLATRDVAATSAFFQATLGFAPIQQPGNIDPVARWLRIAPQQELHLIGVDDFEPSNFEREYGRHVAFCYPGSQFGELKERLSEHGAEIIAPLRETPFERFFFRDPNGYIFEIVDSENA